MATNEFFKPIHQYVSGGGSLEKRIDPPEEYDEEELEEIEREEADAEDAAYEAYREKDWD